jgi:DNA primase
MVTVIVKLRVAAAKKMACKMPARAPATVTVRLTGEKRNSKRFVDALNIETTT